MSNDDNELLEFLDAYLTSPSRSGSPPAQGSTERDQLLDSIAQVEECMQVLDTVWPDDTSFPPQPSGSNTASAAEDLSPRRFGPYEILEHLGSGGMGRVFKARHLRLNKLVAIKILPTERINDELSVSRFRREMQAIGQLTHPNVVSAHGADEIDGIHFLAMEFVDGLTLDHVARRDGSLGQDRAVDYIRQAASGLGYAHRRGIIHRDIKPANLMVTSDEQGKHLIKVLDLGLARLVAAPDEVTGSLLSADGLMVGTVGYVAPEQAQNATEADERSDIYSLGATLYFLLYGRVLDPSHFLDHLPVSGTKDSRSATPGVSAQLMRIVRQMTAADPDKRFASMSDVKTALEGLTPTSNIAPQADPTSPQPMVSRTISRNRIIQLAFVVLFVGVCGFGWTTYKRSQPVAEPWQNLLNGDDLNGWTVIGDGDWTIADSIITADGHGTGWLMLDNHTADFRLRLDYRLPHGGTSGVFVRAWPDGPINGADFLEIRLCDDDHPKFESLAETLRTGALVGLAAPSPSVASAPNVWQTLEVAVAGPLIEICHEGLLVNRINLNDFRDRFKDAPRLIRRDGHIGL